MNQPRSPPLALELSVDSALATSSNFAPPLSFLMSCSAFSLVGTRMCASVILGLVRGAASYCGVQFRHPSARCPSRTSAPRHRARICMRTSASCAPTSGSFSRPSFSRLRGEELHVDHLIEHLILLLRGHVGGRLAAQQALQVVSNSPARDRRAVRRSRRSGAAVLSAAAGAGSPPAGPCRRPPAEERLPPRRTRGSTVY